MEFTKDIEGFITRSYYIYLEKTSQKPNSELFDRFRKEYIKNEIIKGSRIWGEFEDDWYGLLLEYNYLEQQAIFDFDLAYKLYDKVLDLACGGFVLPN